MKQGIVVASGVFDIFHAGHASMLKFCKELGEFVIVLMSSDESVELLTNKHPLMSQDLRKLVLDSCRYVDNVTIFDALTPLEELKSIQPEFFIASAKWADLVIKQQLDEEPIAIQDVVEEFGGRVIFTPTLAVDGERLSTSLIREKIRAETTVT